MKKINVLIYNEFFHEKTDDAVKAVYPDGIHAVLKDFLSKDEAVGEIKTATLDTYEEVLTEENLKNTDVLIWWAHIKHEEIKDEVVERVAQNILDGMGFIALHSAHASKIMRRMLGTRTNLLRWREAGEKARLWKVKGNHPITYNLPDTFTVPHEEMYGEPFGIAEPDELLLLTWFPGGEVFRSGCTWQRGEGKIFYLQNGHETYPVYYQKEIQTLITNAVKWAAPLNRVSERNYGVGNDAPFES